MHLRVADLSGTALWYEEVLGFEVLAEDGVTAALGGAEKRPLVLLHGSPHARPAPPGSAGLFHMAFLLAGRTQLAALLRRVREAGWPVDGYGDHNVSEAVYLRDPEGNGIELYADRPREVWRTVDGEIFMTTEPLDVHGLLMTASNAAPGLPAGTSLGHVHLRVSSLDEAESFWVDRLGLTVVTRRYPGALFFAAGDYHHHVACNVWGERAVTPRRRGTLGLVSFEIVVPDGDYRRAVLDGAEERLLTDPDQVGVRITGG